MKKRIIALALAAASPWCAAEFYDGNDLLRLMRGNHSEQMLAMGYVVGVFDVHRGSAVCPTSPNVTAGQANDVVRNHLERNPQTRHFTGDVVTVVALMAAWPCASGKSNGGRAL